MSEHYDFHYQPTGSGAISGQQVLQQTEDAINELGDYVNDNVGGAMDVAQQALETAQTAETNAQTALDTANSFSGAIQTAQQDASTALSTAQSAQTTASNANNTAIQASQDASNAVTTANNASGQVNTLSGTVTALGQRVTTAEGNIGQNTSDITALTTRVGTAEGNITTLQNDVSIAQGNASSAMTTAGQVKQQAYVFRYSSTTLVASSTNSNALLDNTDNLKVGDKVIDSSGVLFSITAIDTANSTFTIGTALIDLANDSDVVHKSGDENVAGVKSFSDNTYITSLNFINEVPSQSSSSSSILPIIATVTYTDQSPSQSARLNLRITADGIKSLYPHENSAYSLGLSSRSWSDFYTYHGYFRGQQQGDEYSGNARTNLTLTSNRDTVGTSGIIFDSFRENTTQGTGSHILGFGIKENSVRYEGCRLSWFYDDDNNGYVFSLRPTMQGSNQPIRYELGNTSSKWTSVYSTEYYYGANNTPFTDKFVTTDTNQTVSGNKTFSDGMGLNRWLYFTNTSVTKGTIPQSTILPYRIYFGSGVNYANSLFNIDTSVSNTGVQTLTLRSAENVVNGDDTRFLIVYDPNLQQPRYVAVKGDCVPSADNTYECGTSSNKWKTFNGLNPSSLGMPDLSNGIDISSYITIGDTDNNYYTPPANGWIWAKFIGNGLAITQGDFGINSNYVAHTGTGEKWVETCLPVTKDVQATIRCRNITGIVGAKFYPCLGNV